MFFLFTLLLTRGVGREWNIYFGWIRRDAIKPSLHMSDLAVNSGIIWRLRLEILTHTCRMDSLSKKKSARKNKRKDAQSSHALHMGEAALQTSPNRNYTNLKTSSRAITCTQAFTQTRRSTYKSRGSAGGIWAARAPVGKAMASCLRAFLHWKCLKRAKREQCLSSKIAARWSRKCTNFLWHPSNEVLYWPRLSEWKGSLLLFS